MPQHLLRSEDNSWESVHSFPHVTPRESTHSTHPSTCRLLF